MRTDPTIAPHLSDADRATLASIRDRLQAHARPTALLIAQGGADGPGVAGETRLGGHAWMDAGVAWPTFSGEPMAFVGQIQASDIPGLAHMPGTILLFMDPEDYEQGQSNTVLYTKGHGAGLRADGPTSPVITLSAQPALDFPDPADYAGLLGLAPAEANLLEQGAGEDTLYSADIFDQLDDDTGTPLAPLELLDAGKTARLPCWRCDKLGGYPAWEQDSEGPPWPNAIFLAQIVSDTRLSRCEDLPDNANWGTQYIFATPDLSRFHIAQQCD